MSKGKSAGKSASKAGKRMGAQAIKLAKEKAKKMPNIIPKSTLKLNERNILFIAIHCAATFPSMHVDAARIKKWHLERGFNDIGYHFIIARDGTIELGRPISVTGAHVAGYNSTSIGICWIGGVRDENHKEAEDNRTDEQKSTLKQLINELLAEYPKAIVQGHRDFPKVYKACPSFDVKEWCEEVGIKHNQDD